MGRKIFLGLCTCVIAFILMDVALRVYLSVKYKNKQFLRLVVSIDPLTKEQFRLTSKFVQYDGYYKFTPGKYECYVTKFPYYVNPLGFRNRDFSAAKPEGTYRICMLGGSTTFGYNVSDEETCPYYMEKILNETGDGRKYEVINCGFPAYRMKNIYNLFSKEVAGYSLDCIVIYEGWNDALLCDLVDGNSIPWKVHKLLYYKWMLYTLCIEKYSYIKQHNALPVFNRSRHVSEEFSRYLEQTIMLAREKGIRVVMVKQPVNIRHSFLDHVSSLEELRGLYEKEPDLRVAAVIAQHYYTRQIEELAKKFNIAVADPVGAIEARAGIFLDDVHINAEGNMMLAEAIVKTFLAADRRK